LAWETQNTRHYFSHSLARGLAVIRAFGRDAPTLRITDVAARTGLDRAAARRFLLTLVDLNYVGVSGDLFYLRPSALDIGFSYLSSLDPNRLVQPFLNELTDKTRETSSFGILDDFQVRLLARSANNRILNFSIYLGERVPAYRTALGRVLLAGLPEDQFEAYWADLPQQLLMASASLDKTELRDGVAQVRARGWAIIEQTMGEGYAAIAVPIRDQAGQIIAAVNVMEYPPRTSTQTKLKKYLPLLKDYAQQIQSVLTASQHSMIALTVNRQDGHSAGPK
jgi:IclR family transcriptional regulator, pca regulon regulatory protein